MTDIRGQMSDIRGQMSDDRRQKTEVEKLRRSEGQKFSIADCGLTGLGAWRIANELMPEARWQKPKGEMRKLVFLFPPSAYPLPNSINLTPYTLYLIPLPNAEYRNPATRSLNPLLATASLPAPAPGRPVCERGCGEIGNDPNLVENRMHESGPHNRLRP